MPKPTEKYGDVFQTHYFWLCRKLMIGLGHWPYMPRWIKYIQRTLVLAGLLNGFPFVAHALYILWDTNRTESAKAVVPLLTICTCFLKYMNLIVHKTEMEDLLSLMYHTWKTPVDEQYKIVLQYGRHAKAMSLLYLELIYLAMVIYISMPLAPIILDFINPLNETRPRHLVLPISYGTGIQPEGYFALMVCHVNIGVFTALTIVIGSDVFYINLVFHACCLFAIARYYLEHVSDGIPDLSTDLESLAISNENLTRLCIKRITYAVNWHEKALEYSSLVEDSYTWTLFGMLGMNVLMISLTGFQILTQKDMWDEIMIGGAYIFGQLCHLYLLSLPSQMLIDESEQIRDAIAKSYTCDLPVNAQRMLIPILIRGLRPCKISAGKIIILQMETFMSILQMSVSYFTVLANFA